MFAFFFPFDFIFVKARSSPSLKEIPVAIVWIFEQNFYVKIFIYRYHTNSLFW